VVGVVLGQPGGALGPNTAAVDAGDALVRSVFAVLHPYTVVAPGQKAAEIEAAWGATALITVARPVVVVGWPGLHVSMAASTRGVHGALPSGAPIGTLRAGVGSTQALVALRTGTVLAGPGVWWRLTR
jgi:hypothetical protein